MTKGYYQKQMLYLFLKLLACMAFLILLIEFLTSCEHKDLCYDYPHRQNVEVTFDWSEAPDANPSTMSLYLFPENGGAPQRYEFTDRNGGCISVAAGTYDAICVNSDKETHRINGKETRKNLRGNLGRNASTPGPPGKHGAGGTKSQRKRKGAGDVRARNALVCPCRTPGGKDQRREIVHHAEAEG